MKKMPVLFDVILDLLALVILCTTSGSALYFARVFLLQVADLPGAIIWAIPLSAVAFLFSWIIANGVVYWTVIHWNLRSGSFPVGPNRPLFTWYLEFATRRFISYSPFSNFIHALKPLRTLHYLSFGTYVPYSTNLSADIDIQSPRFVKIGPHSMIGSHTTISSRMIFDGKLVYREIQVGEGVNIGMCATLAPGVKIGDGTTIGAYFEGYPIAKIGKNCEISESVRIESGAQIGDGAKIGKHSIIGERVKVVAGAVIPPFSQISN